MSKKRVAIVQEWISARAGSEKVFERLAGLFPDADLYALSWEPNVPLETAGRKIQTTFLDSAFLRNRRAISLPAMPLAWRLMNRPTYDLVLTSHHCLANTFVRRSDKKALSYVHTPARYVWGGGGETRGSSKLLDPAKKILKHIDRHAIRKVDQIIANSTEVEARIKKHWNRDSGVIHPPVEIDFYKPPSKASSRSYVLGFSRWVSYKGLDRVIRIGEAAEMPVVIAGSGPIEGELRELASNSRVPVEIVKRPDNEHLRELYQNAKALVFPAYEDFGIVPVESQACGTPVVGFDKGGTRDTIEHGVSGYRMPLDATDEDFAQAVQQCEDLDSEDCTMNAQKFSPEIFDKKILEKVRNIV